MRALLYHQRYQDWNRHQPTGAIDLVAARREEFAEVRLGRVGHELITEIERYLASVAVSRQWPSAR